MFSCNTSICAAGRKHRLTGGTLDGVDAAGSGGTEAAELDEEASASMCLSLPAGSAKGCCRRWERMLPTAEDREDEVEERSRGPAGFVRD